MRPAAPVSVRITTNANGVTVPSINLVLVGGPVLIRLSNPALSGDHGVTLQTASGWRTDSVLVCQLGNYLQYKKFPYSSKIFKLDCIIKWC